MRSSHRWVRQEPTIPFTGTILYVDERIIVIDKPHFLPTTPRGMWYRSTALMRLRHAFDEPHITPAHRLDRDTAGIVLFVRNPQYRGAYQLMFEHRQVHKIYDCLAPMKPICRPKNGVVRSLEAPEVFPLERMSRIEKYRGVLQAQEVAGSCNARTLIDLPDAAPLCVRDMAGVAWRKYVLTPYTGKTHQLRVHMNSLGLPIAGEVLYPQVVQRSVDDFSHPLQLVARTLRFTDPVDGTARCFTSTIPLGWGA